MAEDLNDGEFWLPSQFLTDDDLLMDFKDTKKWFGGKGLGTDNEGGFHVLYGFNSSFAPNSNLTSPVESVVGSIETERDGENCLAGLTQKLAQSILLQDHLWNAESGHNYDNRKSFSLSGSPQSTLCRVLGGYGTKQGSSRGSPNYPSQASSLPAMNSNDADACDLLCKAADEVARMRMLEDARRFYQNRGLYDNDQHNKACHVFVNLKNPNPELGFNSEQPISYQQLQTNQHPRQKQMVNDHGSGLWGHSKRSIAHYQQNQSHPMVPSRGSMEGGRQLGLSMSVWPTLQQSQQQQKSGSGMRAVFLGNHGSKRECAGTGVFLPKVGATTETSKKPACSTVLLPERVVRALNLNLESMDNNPGHGNISNPDYGINNYLIGERRRYVRGQTVPVMNNNEFRLPIEWTY